MVIRRRAAVLGAARPAALFFWFGLLVIAAAAGAVWVHRLLGPVRPGSKTKVLVTIPAGASAGSISELLARRGLARSRYSFLIEVRLRGGAGRLVAGVYSLSPGQSAEQILNQIENGRNALAHVTFPEGFTLKQVAERLQERRICDGAEFFRIARTDGRSFRCADGFTPPDNNLEGFLFPDSYDFAPDESARNLVQDMLDRFDLRVAQTHPDVRDWREPVIVASMIERETGMPQDRPVVAAVIYNRLSIKMPLQIDATVEYALPEHKARLLYSDLKTRSSYNTYLHRGLPPGAICNPGLPCIDAALHPSHLDYLYYVQGPTGAHIFSRTLAEQDANIAAVRGRRPSSVAPQPAPPYRKSESARDRNSRLM